jgi:hypothetical protein
MTALKKLNNTQTGDKTMEKIKAFILKYLPFLDFNKDGKIDAADAAEAKARVEEIKTEATDVVVAVKEAVKQSKDVVAAAKGKKRSGPKKK